MPKVIYKKEIGVSMLGGLECTVFLEETYG